MKPIAIIAKIYKELTSKITNGRIPIQLRPPALVGTVQDDPFDSWIGDEIKNVCLILKFSTQGNLPLRI